MVLWECCQLFIDYLIDSNLYICIFRYDYTSCNGLSAVSHLVLIGVTLPLTLNPEAFYIDHTRDMEQCRILKCQGLFLKNSRKKFPVKDHNIYIFAHFQIWNED